MMKLSSQDYSTGYSRTALPFYPELDADRFERFCTDLLNLNPIILCQRSGRVAERRIISATRLLSGKPQYGGDIRADVSEGEVWLFQCKRVQNLGPDTVAAAIEDAERGFPHADQYVLVTTCGLIADAQSQIDDRPKWMWWDSSRLTTITQRLMPAEPAMHLVESYFSKDWVKRLFVWGDQPLLPWQEFFAQDLSTDRQHFHHRIPFVPQSNAYDRLKDFALNGTGRAMILSAAGGQGKSRLLLELAKELERQPGAPRVRFLNVDRSGVSEKLADFLSRENVQGDLMLILDDAHRLDATLDDAARATSQTKSTRLLVATRPQALAAIESRLHKHGYAERMYDPLQLPRWKPADMLALAERVLNPAHHHHAHRLAGLADQCPLLVVMGGALINAGKMPEAVTDERDFRERVFKGFIEDFLRLQPESTRERLDRLIRFLAFVSPAPKDDVLREKAAEILSCRALDVAEDIETLQAAGLLAQNREGVRLYPDLFADAVLLDACLDHGDQPSFLHSTVLAKLPISDFPSLMRNLAQADWEARVRKGVEGSLFDPVWIDFVRRFEKGKWQNQNLSFLERLLEHGFDDSANQPDRNELLGQWASFAVYLPERTLELANLAIQSAKAEAAVQAKASGVGADALVSVCSALPPLLKPIVVWHPKHASQALDILWSLEAGEPHNALSRNFNAITAIAEAASYEFQTLSLGRNPAEDVMAWLETKFQGPAAIERLHRQPWILSALLKPFFEHEVDQTLLMGRTIHFSPRFLSAKWTRHLRQKALALANKYLTSADKNLAAALIPVVRKAIHPIYGKFGATPTQQMQEAWRTDRLEVVKMIERGVEAHRDSPSLLLQLRRILKERCDYDDPDEVVRKDCQRVLNEVPDKFELRVARVMTSWVQDETSIKPGPSFASDLAAAERHWTAFRASVAGETVERFKTATELCAFIRRLVIELVSTNSPVMPGLLLDSVAEISTEWSAAVLEELVGTKETTLDGYLTPVLQRAAAKAPEAYRKTIEFLPAQGRPEQLRALISYFGWKHLHGGGLDLTDRQAILESTKRTEEAVVHSLASVAGYGFSNQPRWAIEVLRQLKPTGERDAGEILQALARITRGHAAMLNPEEVAQCLANLGERCFPETLADERHLESVAQRFPKQVYEHLRSLLERAEADPASLPGRGLAKTLSLGPIADLGYVDRERDAHWQKAVSAGSADQFQYCRLALIRSLLWSDPMNAPDRLQKLVAECRNGDELKLASELAATKGSRFVFQFHDLVRALLARAADFGVADAVREALWLSACGGGRTFTNRELDPEYRYILEQGEALSNRYRDDALLGKFYRMIADSERHQVERNKQAFRADDELE